MVALKPKVPPSRDERWQFMYSQYAKVLAKHQYQFKFSEHLEALTSMVVDLNEVEITGKPGTAILLHVSSFVPMMVEALVVCIDTFIAIEDIKLDFQDRVNLYATALKSNVFLARVYVDQPRFMEKVACAMIEDRMVELSKEQQ